MLALPSLTVAECPKAIWHAGTGNRAMDIKQEQLSEQAIVQLQKLEYDHLLASKGLNGTLYGAWASLLTIVFLIFAPTITERDVVTGWQLVFIVAFLVGAVVFYGAFIFNRALTITAGRTREGNVARCQCSGAGRRFQWPRPHGQLRLALLPASLSWRRSVALVARAVARIPMDAPTMVVGLSAIGIRPGTGTRLGRSLLMHDHRRERARRA